MQVEQRRVHAAKNQSLFREVNERIRELRRSSDPIDFACECTLDGCSDSMPLTMAEYEAVRSVPAHFAVLPGHEVAEVERVVAENGRYAVVEKLGAGERVAVAFDPRSRGR